MRRGRTFAFAVAASLSCDAIEPRPLSVAPLNRCPEFACEEYERLGETAASCQAGKCEIQTAGNRPIFPFWIVVHVAESSYFAPGSTYVLVSDERGEPAFKNSAQPGLATRCTPPQCLPIGGLSAIAGSYFVTAEASRDVGYPLPEGTSIPVQVLYEAIGNNQTAQEEFPPLPLDTLFGSSRLTTQQERVLFSRAVPFGLWRRVLYPQPPYDRYFPPTADVQTIASDNIRDRFSLGEDPPGGKKLDDVSGRSRELIVRRADGLDGWRVWLADASSDRRISVTRTLAGTETRVRLDTTGENGSATSSSLRDDVNVVISPPDNWTGVPRYVGLVFQIGPSLGEIPYPALPPPVAVTGIVAQPPPESQGNTPPAPGSTLFGYAARVRFEGTQLLTRTDGSGDLTSSNQLLRYSTTINTDDRGRFATVLPPGLYDVIVEPALGFGFAKSRQPVSIGLTETTLVFQPPKRTPVSGRVLLADQRPLTEADVLAEPERGPSDRVVPRPNRTRTRGDGSFSFELDQGAYVLTVVPKAGTDFPRVVTVKDIPATETRLPDIKVPPPTRLAFRLADPTVTASPVAHAVVRIFANAPGRPQGTPPVEIGNAMTDTQGQVEILLAQAPQ